MGALAERVAPPGAPGREEAIAATRGAGPGRERGSRLVPGRALSVLYADTSALVRAYVADQEGHAQLRRLLLE
ncbi:MAG: hypothetical protein QOD73_224, partial [Solirubrobacteraceae bacterium]|nr:hypothetical protein [Solirubrobacteraceae bacterium]